MALLFISHIQLNTMLVGLVRRLDHITASMGISVTSLKRQKMASLFISHIRLNAILVGLVRRLDHITASLALQSQYFSWHTRKPKAKDFIQIFGLY